MQDGQGIRNRQRRRTESPIGHPVMVCYWSKTLPCDTGTWLGLRPVGGGVSSRADLVGLLFKTEYKPKGVAILLICGD